MKEVTLCRQKDFEKSDLGKSYINQEIVNASFDSYDDRDEGLIKLFFKNKNELIIYDDGQSCCEERYVTTDDDILSIVGKKLRNIELKGSSERESYDGIHEIHFLEISTDQNFITFRSHNDHNGYYGGIIIKIKELNNE